MTAKVPDVVPMVSYEDPGAMASWLVHAFGFTESLRLVDDAGQAVHVELRTGNGALMLGRPGPDYRSPATHRRACTIADAWMQTPYVVDGVLVRVTDVDEHHRVAVAHGAVSLSAPEEQPHGRVYRAEDPEGHRWMFLQKAEGAADIV